VIESQTWGLSGIQIILYKEFITLLLVSHAEMFKDVPPEGMIMGVWAKQAKEYIYISFKTGLI